MDYAADDAPRGRPSAGVHASLVRWAALAAGVLAALVLIVVFTRNDSFEAQGGGTVGVVAVPGASVSGELGQVRVLEDAHIDGIRPLEVSGPADVEIRVHRFRGEERTGIFLNGGCSSTGLPPRTEGSKRAVELDVRRGDVLRVAAIVTPAAVGAYRVGGFEIRYRQGLSTAQTQRVRSGVVEVDVRTTDDAPKTCP